LIGENFSYGLAQGNITLQWNITGKTAILVLLSRKF